VAKLNLLRITRVACEHHPDRATLVARFSLASIVDRLAKQDEAILVRELAKEIHPTLLFGGDISSSFEEGGGEIRRWDWIGFWRGGKWRSGRKDGDGVGREKDQLDEENDERERRGCGVVSREAGAGTSAHKRRDAGKGEGRQASSDCRQGIGREC
jgi:hypothetical protein